MNDEKSWLSENWQKVLAGVFWAVVFGAYAVYTQRNGLSPLGALKALGGFVRSSNYGPVLFIVLYTLRPVFLFSAALLTVGAECRAR